MMYTALLTYTRIQQRSVVLWANNLVYLQADGVLHEVYQAKLHLLDAQAELRDAKVSCVVMSVVLRCLACQL